MKEKKNRKQPKENLVDIIQRNVNMEIGVFLLEKGMFESGVELLKKASK